MSARQELTVSRPAALVPRDFDEAWRFAGAVIKAKWAPQFKSQEEAFGAIAHGLEVGLTPMQAVTGIAMINGRPTIWGDTMLALVRGSGQCEYVKEWIDGDTAYCETKRKSEPEAVTRTFSMTDANAAGLAKKQGPWTQYRDRMLQMRARAFCLRDAYADVLKGLQSREEIQDYQMKDVTPPAPKRADYHRDNQMDGELLLAEDASAAAHMREIAGEETAAPPTSVSHETDVELQLDETPDPVATFIEAALAAIEAAKSVEQVDGYMTENRSHLAALDDSDFQEIRNAAIARRKELKGV